jgi:hypothetical protein
VEALLARGITKCKWMQTKFPFFNVLFQANVFSPLLVSFT